MIRKNCKPSAFAAFLCLSFASVFFGARPASAQTVFFQDVRVFDGLNVLATTNVLVEGERITKIGKGMIPPAGAEIIDGAGKTLLPGLIDAHTHVSGDALEESIEAGVTTVLDMASDPKYAETVRSEQEKGRMLDRADLYSAGFPVSAASADVALDGIKLPTLHNADSAQKFVDARLAEGSDFIEIEYSDGRAFGEMKPMLSKRTLMAVIEAAHKQARLAVAHVGTLEEARTAIEAGVDGLTDIPCDVQADPAFAKFAREHNVFICPTLSRLLAATGGSNAAIANDSAAASFTPQASIAMLTRMAPLAATSANFPAASATTKMLQLAHVPLLAGTDAPNPGTAYGVGLHRELELLVGAGITPTHALAAATANPADAFHLKDRGHICAGCRADLLLVAGDPTTDIRATRNILGVWKRGHKLDRAPFLARVAAVRAGMLKASTPMPVQSKE